MLNQGEETKNKSGKRGKYFVSTPYAEQQKLNDFEEQKENQKNHK